MTQRFLLLIYTFIYWSCKNWIYHSLKLKNEKPAIGFIGALKRIKIYKLPKDSETLETKITILNKLMNALIIKGEVYCKGSLMAEGEMNIFVQNKVVKS